MVHWFFKEVLWCFYPPRYKQLCNRKFRSSLKFMSVVLLVSFLLAGVFFVPKLFTIRSVIESEIDKFSVFRVDTDVVTSSPVFFPPGKPLIVVDTESDRNISKELFVVGENNIQYRLLGKHSVPLSGFEDVKENKRIVSGFLAVLFFLLLPSVFILLYIKFWIKYFLLIFLVSVLFFILFELSRWRLKFKQVLNIALHTSIVMILVEVISSAFSTAYLFPFLRFLGVDVFAVSLGLFCVFTFAGIIFVNVGVKNK